MLGKMLEMFFVVWLIEMFKEVEDEVNFYFQRIYNQLLISIMFIDEVLDMFKRFKDLSDKKEKVVK